MRALPDLPLTIPVPDLSSVPTVPLPGGSVDLKPIVAALLPDGKLPNVDIVRVQGVAGLRVNGAVRRRPSRSSRHARRSPGISVLGQELPLNEVVERTVSLVDSQNIDPSNANLADVQLPLGLTLDTSASAARSAAAPAGARRAPDDLQSRRPLATVKITPAQQIREGNRLTQRALQVQVGLLGQQLVDLVIGEASVGFDAVDCAVQTAAEQALRVHDPAPRARRRHPRPPRCGCSATRTSATSAGR